MALGVIVTIVLVVLWALVFWLGLPLAWGLVATLVLALGVGGLWAWRSHRAKAAARALERELLRQGELQVAGARPDLRAGIVELQTQLRRGIETLKATKLGGRGGERALYALPWYVIVGPPGAGKTTALQHSGLQFPIDAPGGKVRGVGGTRNCDWIFTNEAILLDTAGRYATQDEDRTEWLAFLDLLRRYRPHKPVNGLLVAVSLADLATATEEQAEQLARTLRSRIDEIMTQLRMVVPVYVLFTKTDLVPGFLDFWEDLKKSERAQVWGATLPLFAPAAVDPGERFGHEFDALIEALHGLALRRVAALPRLEARARVLLFPLQMRALRAPLTEFARTLFVRNSYQDTPLFRGFYFTSGTQEGRPLDVLLGHMGQAFGLHLPAVTEGAPVEPKSYFLTEVFRKVVFPDQHVAARTTAEIQRQLLVRFGVFAACVLAALAMVAPALVSFVKNRSLTAHVRAAGEEAQRADWAKPQEMRTTLAHLRPLHEQLTQLERWREEGPPVGYGWGFYTGDVLEASAGKAFGGTLRTQLVLPAAHRLEQQLGVLDSFTGNRASERYGVAYEQLKMYLMLTEVEHLDVAWATPRLARSWAEPKGQPDLATDARLLELVRHHLELVKRHVVEPAPPDESIVRHARSVLLNTPPLERLYENLLHETNVELAPIRHEMIFYGAVRPYVLPKQPNVVVEGAYTKVGWQRVRTLLDEAQKRLLAESWVLGTDERMPEAEVAKQVARLRERYFGNYSNAWRTFLLNLDVQEPTNAGQALEELLALAEPEWPYLRLFRMLQENVTLDIGAPPPVDAATGDPSLFEKLTDEAKKRLKLGQTTQAAKPAPPERVVSPVEQAFQPLIAFSVPPEGAKPGDVPTGLAQYMGVVRKLVGALTELHDADRTLDTKALVEEHRTAYLTASTLLAEQPAMTRPLLAPLLMRPITLSWASVMRDASVAAGGLWELDVWKPWDDKLAHLFPFDQSPDKRHASIDDFAEFFRPQGGTLWGFYEKNLKNALFTKGDGFIPARRFGREAPFSNELLGCLKTSRAVTRTFFSEESKEPLFAFDVNLHSVSPDVAEVTLTVDGTPYKYRNTPEEWLSAQWPGKTPKERGASLSVRGYSELRDELKRPGDFGLFELLKAAEDIQLVSGGGQRGGKATAFIASWKLNQQLTGATVKIEFRPAKAEYPFSPTFFSALRCPRLITAERR